MDAKKISYNLNGHGLITTYIYPYTQILYNFLSEQNYDAKFHHTNQLGALKDSLHGAHYTRYEYIILQWYLIHQLNISQKATGVGVNTKKDNFGVLDEIGVPPTVGEIFQCTSVLANMGHFPDTFAASKLWVHLLKENVGRIRRGFRSGLDSKEKDLLDNMLDNGDVYKIHLVNAMFLLNRYTGFNDKKELIDVSKSILLDYAQKDDIKFKRYWDMYSIVRKLSYLLLDSTYAPLPFKLELSSIISNIDDIFSGLSIANTTLNNTIEQVNSLLQESLYLADNSMITSSKKTIELKDKFNSHLEQKELGLHKISVVRKLLEPINDNSNELSSIFNDYNEISFPKITWDNSNCLQMIYKKISSYNELFPNEMLSWETALRENCGMRSCIVSAFKNPNRNTFKVTYATIPNNSCHKRIRSILKFISKITTLDYELEKSGYLKEILYENRKKTIKYVLKNIFGGKKEYNIKLSYQKLKKTNSQPYFSGMGTQNIAKRIEVYLNHAKEVLDVDQLHEIEMVIKSLKEIDYHGYVIVFAGSTEMWEDSKTTPYAEFDGIILFPNRNKFLKIVEAKNKTNGATSARKQLKKRIKDTCPSELNYEINKIGSKAAEACFEI